MAIKLYAGFPVFGHFENLENNHQDFFYDKHFPIEISSSRKFETYVKECLVMSMSTIFQGDILKMAVLPF